LFTFFHFHFPRVARFLRLDLSQSQQPQILKTLESLNIWSGCEDTRSLQRCIDLLSLTSLSSFDARGLGQWYDELRFEPETTFTSLLNLTLVHCKLSGSVIQDLFTKYTTLRTLTINSEFALASDEIMPILRTTVFAALKNLAGTLERLTMMMPDYFTNSCLDVSAFGRLRYLEADQHLLLHNQGHAHLHDNLPVGLQQLVIRRTTTSIEPSLESFFDTFVPTPRFTGLSGLRLYTLRHEHDELKEERLIGFKIRAQQYRVNFEWAAEPAHSYQEFWEPNSDSEPDSDSEGGLNSERGGDSDNED
jgi:hypothetical protein